MKIVLVAGARPNFMKIASVIDAIHAHNKSEVKRIEHVLVHTGQHYSAQMSQAFFDDLRLPHPDVDLGVGSGSHAQQTADIMKKFESVLLKEQPDVVMVVGDVNSTVACALVAAKMAFSGSGGSPAHRTRPLIAHVEAGLRSFDRSMPEEVNRLLTDALSDVLLVTEKSAEKNLMREGVAKEKIHLVGNTMVDTLLKHRERAKQSTIISRLGLREDSGRSQARPYAVLTLHRPSNVDDPDTLKRILDALSVVAKDIPIYWPVHPRTLNRIEEFGLQTDVNPLHTSNNPTASDSRIYSLEPLGYLDFLCLMSNSKLILTDSGGIQEESTVLGIPCVTLRENTERPVTMTQGTNVLAGTERDAIIRHAARQLKNPRTVKRPRFWDGRAGERVIRILLRAVSGTD